MGGGNSGRMEVIVFFYFGNACLVSLHCHSDCAWVGIACEHLGQQQLSTINPYRPIIPPFFSILHKQGGIIGPEHQNFPAAFGGRNQPIRSLFIPLYCCFLLARRRREIFCPFRTLSERFSFENRPFSKGSRDPNSPNFPTLPDFPQKCRNKGV